MIDMSAAAFLLLSLLGGSSGLPQIITTNGIQPTIVQTGVVNPGRFCCIQEKRRKGLTKAGFGSFGNTAIIGLGRTQVFANQRFGINQRMAIEVVQGGLLCVDGFTGRQFLMRPGQVITFRGGSEICQAQVPSVILTQIV